MLLTLSAITPADESFLLTVYACTRADEMALVPWDDAQKDSFIQNQFQAQYQYYQSRYPNARYDLILMDEERVGRLYVAQLDDEIRILDITVLPAYRRRGIGTKLIRGILKQALKENKSVQIYLETFNQAAKLFTELNFEPVEEDGIYRLWRWNIETQANQLHITA